jgi:uncharacterized protein (TIGR03083 family)
MDHDYKDLFWTQSAALADLIEDLPDEAFDHDTLCDGWKVRDVMGHMLVGHTYGAGTITKAMVKYRFNVPKGSFEMSKDLAATLTPDEIRTKWRAVVTDHTRRGIAKTIPYRDGFLDHFIHEQDIRRPLGMDPASKPEVVTGALDALAGVKGPMFSTAKVVKGLKLEATDTGWTHGEGAVVRGPATALVMSAAGRPSAYDELNGDGVTVLTQRKPG